MDAPSLPPLDLPDALQAKMRALQHDLVRMRDHYKAGHLKPTQYDAVERILRERLLMIEAEVQARLLSESRMSQLPKGLRLN